MTNNYLTNLQEALENKRMESITKVRASNLQKKSSSKGWVPNHTVLSK